MRIDDASQLAMRLMSKHLSWEWSLTIDNTRTRLGVTRFATKEIGLSRHLITLNDERQVRDVIMHEIAHALVGPSHGHDWTWKMQARALGARPQACQTPADGIVTAPALWVGTCPHCAREYRRNRLTDRVRVLGQCPRCHERLAWRKNR